MRELLGAGEQACILKLWMAMAVQAGGEQLHPAGQGAVVLALQGRRLQSPCQRLQHIIVLSDCTSAQDIDSRHAKQIAARAQY